MHEQHQACINACTRCAVECEHCFTACLKETDLQARTHCVELLRDCIDICLLAVSYMARGSDHAKPLCELCAQICAACGAECARFQDEHCQGCAAECRRCVEECNKMAGKVPAMA